MGQMILNLWSDVLCAFRSLWRRPRFSLGIIAVMAVGIGTNIAVFTYFAHWHFATIPAPEPEDVVWLRAKGEDPFGTGLIFADFQQLKKEELGLSQLSAGRLFGASLLRTDKNSFHWGRAVEGDYFGLFGARAHLGRLLAPSDDLPSNEPVMVLSHLLWIRQFAADPNVVGTMVELDGRYPMRIVGVAPEGFQGAGLAVGFYVPIHHARPLIRGLGDPENTWTAVLGRLAEGTTLAQAEERVAARSAGLDDESPLAKGSREFFLSPAQDLSFDGSGDDPLVLGSRFLMAAVLLLLVLACFNVANLMAARANARHRELSIHASLGAGNLRIARRLLFEGLMLAVAGGGLGWWSTRWTLGLINGYLTGSTPVGFGDWGDGSSIYAPMGLVQLFFVAVTFGVALLSSVLPIRSVLRRNLVSGLTRSSDSTQPGGRRVGRALVVFQMALSVVLLFGATLLIRTFIYVQDRDLGFQVEQRYATMVQFSSPAESGVDRRQWELERFESILREVRQLPEVRSAAVLTHVPPGYLAKAELRFDSGKETREVSYNQISDGYFSTLGVPIILGRGFDSRDLAPSARTVVINRAAAELFWPGKSSLGQSLRVGKDEGARYEGLGVSAQAHDYRLELEEEPLIYFNYRQKENRRYGILAHAQGPFVATITEFLRNRYPDVSIRDVQPLAEQVRRAGGDQRMYSDLSSIFAGLGLLLAAIGIFGVTSHDVGRRRREMAVRRAMGASRGSIRRLILGDTGRLLIWGSIIGWIGALALVDLIRSLIFGVGPLDPWSFAVATAALAVVALAAVWIPAQRASQTPIMDELGRE